MRETVKMLENKSSIFSNLTDKMWKLNSRNNSEVKLVLIR